MAKPKSVPVRPAVAECIEIGLEAVAGCRYLAHVAGQTFGPYSSPEPAVCADLLAQGVTGVTGRTYTRRRDSGGVAMRFDIENMANA